MGATNTIYEIMTLLASATKGLKKSIDLDGIDIFIAQSMTDIVRKVRDLAPEDMDILNESYEEHELKKKSSRKEKRFG